jgi:hypothetical protein
LKATGCCRKIQDWIRQDFHPSQIIVRIRWIVYVGYVTEDMHKKFSSKNLKEREDFEYLCADRKIILK